MQERLVRYSNELNKVADMLAEAAGALGDRTIRRIIGIIYQNLGRMEFTVNALSEAMGMSRINLYLKIREKTTLTPVELIRAVRMHEAARMLMEGNSNVSEVAYMVGFNETRYFSRYFKTAFGILPSAFSRKYK